MVGLSWGVLVLWVGVLGVDGGFGVGVCSTFGVGVVCALTGCGGTVVGVMGDVGVGVAGWLARGNVDAAFRVVFQFVVDVEGCVGEERVGLCGVVPSLTGDVRFDALLAGLVEFLSVRDGFPVPGWVFDECRYVDGVWDVEPVLSLREAARVRTPVEFSSRGVFVDPREFEYV